LEFAALQQRQVRHLLHSSERLKRIEKLGFKVTLQALAEAA
jgi:hypothetical protein